MSTVVHTARYKTGFFFSDEFRGESSWNGYENNVLLRNEGPSSHGPVSFTDVALAVGADTIEDSRSVAVLDYDRDGDLDLAISTNPGDTRRGATVKPVLLRNNMGNRRKWLEVELRGTKSNRDAVGATVSIEMGESRQLQVRSLGTGYGAQHATRLHFGVGSNDVVDGLTVRWPSGGVERFEQLETNKAYLITEGSGIKPLPALHLNSAPVGPPGQ